jgi:hypothetical protein
MTSIYHPLPCVEEHNMGSRDRPSREPKKKPKADGAKQKLQPLLEPPQNVELIRKPRKPRQEQEEADEG